MATTSHSRARIDLRTTPEIKSLIERAAAINGMTVSEFAKSALVEKCRDILERHELRVLSDRDRDQFLALLEAPPNPNSALRAAAADFRTAVESGTLIPG